MEGTLSIDLCYLEKDETDNEAAYNRRDNEHDTLEDDQQDYIIFRKPDHSHYSQLKTFWLHWEHEEGVNEEDWDHEKEKHHQVEDQLKESHWQVSNLELLKDEGLNLDWEIAKGLFDINQMLHYVLHNFVELLKVVVLSWTWQSHYELISKLV